MSTSIAERVGQLARPASRTVILHGKFYCWFAMGSFQLEEVPEFPSAADIEIDEHCRSMSTAKTNWKEACRRGVSLALLLAFVCLQGLPVAYGGSGSPKIVAPRARLLSAKEGRVIVNVALGLERPALDTLDCSHLIHAVYENAGFEYPYQSSHDLYVSAEKFERVKSPHAGDLIVWPGHVGIVVNPSQHSFYSLVRTGIEQQDYAGPYWKSRGTPHFYRYKLDNARK